MAPTPGTVPAQPDLNEVELQEADAVARQCDADPSTVMLDGDDGHGLSYWCYATTDGFHRRAKASGEYHLGVSVEACGGPNNGIDVIATSGPGQHGAAVGHRRHGCELHDVDERASQRPDLQVGTHLHGLGPVRDTEHRHGHVDRDPSELPAEYRRLNPQPR